MSSYLLKHDSSGGGGLGPRWNLRERKRVHCPTQKKLYTSFAVSAERHQCKLLPKVSRRQNLSIPLLTYSWKLETVQTHLGKLRNHHGFYCTNGTVQGGDIEPFVTPWRWIQTALREKFKAELDCLKNIGVLAKVDEPTAWVSSVVRATKKWGALRICINPRPLNQVLKREKHQLPILDDLMPELARAKIFSTVDLTAGYWQCILDNESIRFTTFATPFGRYRLKRLPFGLSASSEIFQERVSQALEGLEGILNTTDDILIHGVGDTKDEACCDHDW